MMRERIRTRLKALSAHLGDADWLDGDFSAGDLMIVMVLRRLEGDGLVEEFANLAAYVERAKARPAYQRAYADQYAVFAALTG